ncbi:MAG: type II toxin-antitoxin system Phd/YefM family antitoxin [Candidatus Doudnabacteria bacterium]|nr:type II toxin-antitoxin system Phd/YefM family antitoxin [Candidatus Doudnabacteria bacterium]
MDEQIISIRQIQRNYRQLINQAKKTGRPVYLGARLKKEAVLIDAESYEKLKAKASYSGPVWGEIKESLAKLRKSGKKQNLSKFIYADRNNH